MTEEQQAEEKGQRGASIVSLFPTIGSTDQKLVH